MKITKANVDELNTTLQEILDDTGQQVLDAADTWLDEENTADERRDAREVLEDQIPTLRDQLEDLAKLLA